MMNRSFHIIIYMALLALTASAQRPQWDKLSPWVRRVVIDTQPAPLRVPPQIHREETCQAVANKSCQTVADNRQLCAFVRVTPGDDQVLADYGGRSLARFGDIHIATLPVGRVGALSADRRVLRIEASPSHRQLNDSMAVHLNATAAYTGQGLPQAFTGRGVVVGVMDIGFDLTHPTFFSRDTTTYRISRLWDQLSQDTVGSTFYVGRDYTTTADILALGHCRDGLDLTHGTHTLGTAAGSGYDSPWQGMAPEADICLVANAVSDDIVYIDSADIYKYTYATDALGFKYIFDYAQSVGRPCVISFSEGSPQDFWGYDQLYYAILDSLTGPGRIIVSSAGNEGAVKSWFRKPRGMRSAGAFIYSYNRSMTVTLKSADAFTLRLVAYEPVGDTLLLRLPDVLQQPDSLFTHEWPDVKLKLELLAYPSCYDAGELCYDLTLTSPVMVGYQPRLALELMGDEADVELWRVDGQLRTFDENPLLTAGEYSHCVLSPSSAPSVISVGATSWRDFVVNLQGDTMRYWPGEGGLLAGFSSVGPTMDGRTKPDCVAPGNNIVSAFSSFYIENHPNADDLHWDVARFTFRDRTYAWTANSGTSMSSPAVAGAIALWLQADPTLTPARVMDILSATCRHSDPSLTYPNNLYGHGEIDTYRGLLHILGLSAVSDLPVTHTRARITVKGRQLSVLLPQPATVPMSLRLFALDGRPVFTATIPAATSSCLIALPPLSPGIYAAALPEGSTLVRL